MPRYPGRIKTDVYEVDCRDKYNFIYEYGKKISRLTAFDKKGKEISYSNCKTHKDRNYLEWTLQSRLIDNICMNFRNRLNNLYKK